MKMFVGEKKANTKPQKMNQTQNKIKKKKERAESAKLKSWPGDVGQKKTKEGTEPTWRAKLAVQPRWPIAGALRWQENPSARAHVAGERLAAAPMPRRALPVVPRPRHAVEIGCRAWWGGGGCAGRWWGKLAAGETGSESLIFYF